MDIVDVEMRSAINSCSLEAIDKAFPAWKDRAQRGASALVPTREAFWAPPLILSYVLELRCFDLERKKKMPYIWSGLVDHRFSPDETASSSVRNHARLAAGRLVAAGISPNEFSGYDARHRGEHPIVHAIRTDNIMAAEVLLEMGLDLEVFGGVAELSRKVRATQYGTDPHREILQLLQAHETATALRAALTDALDPHAQPQEPRRRLRM